jgi:hypothetical protein
VVRPDRVAENDDPDQRQRHQPVAEDRLAGVGRDDLGDDPEAGQHHDVDGRVRVEPEDVLVADDVAAPGELEELGADGAVEGDHELGAGDEGGCGDDEQ